MDDNEERRERCFNQFLVRFFAFSIPARHERFSLRKGNSFHILLNNSIELSGEKRRGEEILPCRNTIFYTNSLSVCSCVQFTILYTHGMAWKNKAKSGSLFTKNLYIWKKNSINISPLAHGNFENNFSCRLNIIMLCCWHFHDEFFPNGRTFAFHRHHQLLFSPVDDLNMK